MPYRRQEGDKWVDITREEYEAVGAAEELPPVHVDKDGAVLFDAAFLLVFDKHVRQIIREEIKRLYDNT